VTVRLTEGQDEARAGMAADVTFKFDVDPNAPRYTLPAYAVGEDREGRFVFKLEKTEDGLGVVNRSPVVVGELLSDGLEIVSGIDTGDLVVTAGVSRIYDGLTVRVPPRPGSEPANLAAGSEPDAATEQDAQ
jgi:multidrug efflux pump subunit AcrA (membrane-fusion protein)